MWKEANQSDFGWEPFVSSYLNIVPIMVLLFLFWLSVCSMSCVQALHINYHQLWQLNSSVGQIKEWLLHVQSLQMSFFSSDLIWILMIRNFSSNITWAPSNSQYMVSKTNLQIIVSLSRRERVERKWSSFRLLYDDGTSITTHIWPSQTICPLLVGVRSYIHTYTYLVAYETIHQICIWFNGIIHNSAFVLMAIYH